jgi:hypothetical protein
MAPMPSTGMPSRHASARKSLASWALVHQGGTLEMAAGCQSLGDLRSGGVEEAEARGMSDKNWHGCTLPGRSNSKSALCSQFPTRSAARLMEGLSRDVRSPLESRNDHAVDLATATGGRKGEANGSPHEGARGLWLTDNGCGKPPAVTREPHEKRRRLLLAHGRLRPRRAHALGGARHGSSRARLHQALPGQGAGQVPRGRGRRERQRHAGARSP